MLESSAKTAGFFSSYENSPPKGLKLDRATREKRGFSNQIEPIRRDIFGWASPLLVLPVDESLNVVHDSIDDEVPGDVSRNRQVIIDVDGEQMPACQNE